MTSLAPRPAPVATAFNWGLYSDATFAGLSTLVPVPFLDSAFEWFFSRRVPGSVAGWRGRRLAPAVLHELNHNEEDWTKGCLMLPITLTWGLFKRLSKKVLYFLTIKEATDKLSHHWHRAFLIDYALQQGHLDAHENAQVARQAIEHALATATTSPLEQLAQRLIPHTSHITRSLRRARKGEEDAEMTEKRDMMAKAWAGFAEYLADVAFRYDRAYAQWLAERAAKPLPPSHADVTEDTPSG